ncbi:uncharacterized protein LOC123877344 [Maniola jurtina]|uniref:uncharacterized protein LOC123877344 n=1 Tax=Maniola jurtina TaxID=191418 RepID=UPI001E68AFCD|nr:uncharacterized protein LOC123877344 [Maniola jurtina]
MNNNNIVERPERQARKRANKKQREYLVEKLHANIEIARENTALREVVDFWAELSNELNQLGCCRTVQEWQHIWNLWVSKVKIKARKVRDTIRATGGGPAGAGLTDIEEKILDIVGSASVDGFVNLEAALPPSPGVVPPGEPLHEVLPPVHPESPVYNEAEVQSTPRIQNSSRVHSPHRQQRHRTRPHRRPRPPVHGSLVASLNENNRLLRETIGTAAESIAAAMRDSSAAMVRASEIIAAAIQSAGVPVFIQQNENNTN